MILSININIAGKEQTINMEEARILYDELSTLFGRAGAIPSGPIHREPEPAPAPRQTRVEPKPKTADKYANPRVEAAKERAAVRTSGCGSRR